MGSGDACLCVLYIIIIIHTDADSVTRRRTSNAHTIIPLGEEKARFPASLTRRKPFFERSA